MIINILKVINFLFQLKYEGKQVEGNKLIVLLFLNIYFLLYKPG